MACIDSLRLLLVAEIPTDLESIEATLRAIVERLDELVPGTPVHTIVHARINDLLTARDLALEEQARRARSNPGAG